MTPRKLTPEERIARALRGLKLNKLKQDSAKTEVILMRVSEAEKEEIKTVAEGLEISLTEYLLGLHRQAVVQLRKGRSQPG